MKKLLIILIVIAVIIIGYLLIARAPGTPATPEAGVEPANIVTVSYENRAFSPASVEINTGDGIMFTNNHSAAIRIASNPHPIHTSYRKLESGSLQPGESYTFVATEPVTINYHNHFDPNIKGSIIVN